MYSPEKHSEYELARYHQRRADATKRLGGKCVVCGSTEGLEIDHRNREEKSFDLGKLWSISEAKYEEELKKCQLLCKEHHKEKTLGELTGPREHGTATTYRKEHCRCQPCREAANAYRREWRLRSGRSQRTRGPNK